MADCYGFVSVFDINSKHDPIRVLRIAKTKASLLKDKSYDPENWTLWPRERVLEVSEDPISVTNSETGDSEKVFVCDLGFG
jgi:hypothetical protein